MKVGSGLTSLRAALPIGPSVGIPSRFSFDRMTSETNMNEDNRRYWFPAKRYGWGWGFPTRWQGWIVMIVWTAGVIVGNLKIAPMNTTIFLGFMVIMVVVLIAVCYATGEPPGWRWRARPARRPGRRGG